MTCCTVSRVSRKISTTKRKLSVKTLLEKWNALRDIEEGISNKEVVIKYPNNKISTSVKNKGKYFKEQVSAPNKKRRLRESDFEKLDKVACNSSYSKEVKRFHLVVLLLRKSPSFH